MVGDARGQPPGGEVSSCPDENTALCYHFCSTPDSSLNTTITLARQRQKTLDKKKQTICFFSTAVSQLCCSLSTVNQFILTESVFLGDGTNILHGDHSCTDINEELVNECFVFSLCQALSQYLGTLLKHLLQVLAGVFPAGVLLCRQNVHVFLNTEVVVEVHSLTAE